MREYKFNRMSEKGLKSRLKLPQLAEEKFPPNQDRTDEIKALKFEIAHLPLKKKFNQLSKDVSKFFK